MNSIELINIIKKMLADRLTTSEREQLLNEKPMVNFQSQQWDKAPKAHIQVMLLRTPYSIRLWSDAGTKNSL